MTLHNATDADVENKKGPFTMFETVYTYDGGGLVSGYVKPIQVTRYGISTELGATSPSISFVSHDGHRAHGSVDMFYLTEADAAAEVAEALAEQRRKDDFPAILEAARLGVCSEDVKDAMDISDEEAQRLYDVITATQSVSRETF